MYLKDFRCLSLGFFLSVKACRGLVLARAWGFQYLAWAEALASLSYLLLPTHHGLGVSAPACFEGHTLPLPPVG